MVIIIALKSLPAKLRAEKPTKSRFTIHDVVCQTPNLCVYEYVGVFIQIKVKGGFQCVCVRGFVYVCVCVPPSANVVFSSNLCFQWHLISRALRKFAHLSPLRPPRRMHIEFRILYILRYILGYSGTHIPRIESKLFYAFRWGIPRQSFAFAFVVANASPNMLSR